MFWKKQTRIEEMIEQYLAASTECVGAFVEAFEQYFSSGRPEELEAMVSRIRRLEWQADQQRRQIERELFDQALIPALRSDVLQLLEALDRVPNKCEEVVGDTWLMGVVLPEEYRQAVGRLVAVNAEANDRLCDVVRRLFHEPDGVAEAADQVVAAEQQADRIEQELIRAIFRSGLDLAEKLLLKNFVSEIAKISDRAEDASDIVRIIAVKQKT